MKLYELDEELERFWQEIDLQNGEITEDQELRLEGLQKSWEAKMLNSSIALKRLKANEKALREVQKKITSQLHSVQHHIEWLEGYVGRSLGHGRHFKDPSGVHRLWWKESERVEPVDPGFAGINEEWLEREEVVRLKKQEIKDYVKRHEGAEIEGVKIETYWNLQCS